ncbi:ArsR family transcriptional regulator, partial [Pseudomonas syringae pv. actinidiae ICMP 18804]
MQIDLDDIIKALAHPVRREILTWLKDPRTTFPAQEHSIEHGVCAGQIDQRAGLSQSTVSAHLATLQRAGLISSKKVLIFHLLLSRRCPVPLSLLILALSAFAIGTTEFVIMGLLPDVAADLGVSI